MQGNNQEKGRVGRGRKKNECSEFSLLASGRGGRSGDVNGEWRERGQSSESDMTGPQRVRKDFGGLW
jgi:hypothetical protein